jgi:acetyl esterase/lipase
MADSKIQGLTVLQTPFKTVDNQEIRTDILVPQTPFSGKRPVIVRLHGGGFVRIASLGNRHPLLRAADI